MVVLALILMALSSAGGRAVAESDEVHPPPSVVRQLDGLTQIDRVQRLPAAIRNGTFCVRPCYMTRTWLLENQHSDWNDMDMYEKPASNRRLIHAWCSASLCVIHYEQATSGEPLLNLLAVRRSGKRWYAIWRATGYSHVADLFTLRAMLHNWLHYYHDADLIL